MNTAAGPGTGGSDPHADQLGSLLAELNSPVVTDTDRVVTGPPARRPVQAPQPVRRTDTGDSGDTRGDTTGTDAPVDAGLTDHADDTGGPAETGRTSDVASTAADDAGTTPSRTAATPAMTITQRPRAPLPRTFGRARTQDAETLLTSASIPSHLLRELQRRQLEERTVGRQLRIGRYLNDAVRSLPSRPTDLAAALTAHADELNVGRTSRDEGWRPMTTKGIRLDADANAHLDKLILSFYDKYDTQLTRNQLIGLALLRALRA
jgi:hypothetical protein